MLMMLALPEPYCTRNPDDADDAGLVMAFITQAVQLMLMMLALLEP